MRAYSGCPWCLLLVVRVTQPLKAQVFLDIPLRSTPRESNPSPAQSPISIVMDTRMLSRPTTAGGASAYSSATEMGALGRITISRRARGREVP